MKAIVLFLILLSTSIADDWLTGGVNHDNTRHQEDDILNKHNIDRLTVKWFRRTGLYCFNQPTSIDDYLYFGEFAASTFLAINTTNNATIWSVSLAGPVAGGTTISGSDLFVCTIGGACYRLNRFTGATIWVRFLGAAVWSTPLNVGNRLIVGLNPGEESSVTYPYLQTSCCQTRGSIMYLNSTDGTTLNQTFTIPAATFINVTLPVPNVYQGLNSTTTFLFGPSGAATWGDFAYSDELDLIFVCTGQAYSPNASGLIPKGVDSCFALDLLGNIRWETSVREARGNDINDIWNIALYWDPKNPTDVDIGSGPMFYKLTGADKDHTKPKTKYVIATGDKRGIWYTFDAETGSIYNGIGYDALPGVPYPTSSGGFNLGTTGGKLNGVWRSFGNLLSTYSSQICNNSGNLAAQCVRNDFAGNYSAHVVAMSGNGFTELDRFTRNNTLFFGGFALCNKMLFVRDALNKKLLVLDAENLNDILLELDLSAYMPGVDFGASIMIANGRVFLGTGIFGSPFLNGMIALELAP